MRQDHKRRSEAHRDVDVLKGVAAGMISGLVASWTMNQFQSLLSKLAEGEERGHGAQSMQQGTPQHGIGRELQKRNSEEADDDAAERTANAISEGVFGHKLTETEKDTAGIAVHYAFGTITATLYGAFAELLPEVTSGAGAPFGAFVWLTADEMATPALGLSKSPAEYPPSIHAYALASHIVYGLTTELVRRAVRRAL